MRDNPFVSAITSTLTNANQQYLSAFGIMMRLAAPSFQTAALVQGEAVSFAVRRARAAAELPRRLAACRAPQDVMALQKVLWLEATDDGVSSLRRIASAYGHVLPSLTPMRPTAAPAITAAPKRDYLEPAPKADEALVTVRSVIDASRVHGSADADVRPARAA